MKHISKVLIFSWALTVLLSFNVYAKANEQYSNNGTILHYVLEDGKTAPEHWEKKNGTWYYYSENNIVTNNTATGDGMICYLIELFLNKNKKKLAFITYMQYNKNEKRFNCE